MEKMNHLLRVLVVDKLCLFSPPNREFFYLNSNFNLIIMTFQIIFSTSQFPIYIDFFMYL